MKKYEIYGTLTLPFSFVSEGKSRKQAVEKLNKILANWSVNYDTEADIATIDGDLHKICIHDVDVAIEDVDVLLDDIKNEENFVDTPFKIINK